MPVSINAARDLPSATPSRNPKAPRAWRLTAWLAGFFLAAIATQNAHAFNFATTDGGPVPEVAFLDADGNERSLADFQGRVVVLNLWATWCAPCRKEMPSLDRLQAKLGGDDLEVIALAVDRGDLAKIVGFYEEIGIENLGIYHDSSAKAGRTLRALGLPTTLIIDREGQEVGRVLGDAAWDGEDVITLLNAVIAP